MQIILETFNSEYFKNNGFLGQIKKPQKQQITDSQKDKQQYYLELFFQEFHIAD